MKGLTLLCVVIFFVGVIRGDTGIPGTPGFQIIENVQFKQTGSSGQSAVYRLYPPAGYTGGSYEQPPYFVRLQGSRNQMGRDYATLVGADTIAAYDAVLQKANVSLADRELLEGFGSDQWHNWLSVQTPAQYLEELAGVKQVSNRVYTILTCVIVLANLPSDLPEDLVPIMADEAANPSYGQQVHGGKPASFAFWSSLSPAQRQRLVQLLAQLKGFSCSMFGVWGSRTEEGQLFSCRNLDYGPNMGVNNWKSVTMWVPDDGAIPHVAYGFLPVYGVLSGNSARGLTVHEANLEEKSETFRGFPWIIRLRYIMENAADLATAQQLWSATNNTVGYNHMIASAADVASGNPTPAVVYETSAFYSAPFYANSEVEATALHNGQIYGFPLPEALWRTNHPYDAQLSAGYLWWNYTAYRWSQQRYMFAHDGFVYYENANIPIGALQAINITSIIADKGRSYPYKCTYPDATLNGENILSVTHQPFLNTTYVAWDNGQDTTWSPACCNFYMQLDFTSWW